MEKQQGIIQSMKLRLLCEGGFYLLVFHLHWGFYFVGGFYSRKYGKGWYTYGVHFEGGGGSYFWLWRQTVKPFFNDTIALFVG